MALFKLGKLPEARVAAQRSPFRIDAQEHRREIAGDGEELLDDLEGLVQLADLRIDATEILQDGRAIEGVAGDREKLHGALPLADCVLLAPEPGIGAAQRRPITEIVGMLMHLRLELRPRRFIERLRAG